MRRRITITRTLGRARPLLAGERGEYAVAAGQNGRPVDLQQVVADRYLG